MKIITNKNEILIIIIKKFILRFYLYDQPTNFKFETPVFYSNWKIKKGKIKLSKNSDLIVHSWLWFRIFEYTFIHKI